MAKPVEKEPVTHCHKEIAMDTAMSSKRVFEPVAPHGTIGATGWSIIAFVAGIVLMAAGIMGDVAFLAAVGFIGFVSALMYWNAMFWSRVLKDKKVSRTIRYYY